jgi:hypothetical protein
LQSLLLQIDVSQIIAHEGDEPCAVFDLLDADGLAGKYGGEIDLLAMQADAPAAGDDNLAVVLRAARVLTCLDA